MAFKNLQMETGYLVEPISLDGVLAVHQIQILPIFEENCLRVRFTLDPNRCTVDSFGDPKGCTRIATVVLEATAELLEERDGKELFCIKFKGAGPAIRIALLPPCIGRDVMIARLLVFGEKGEARYIIPLQASPSGCVTV